MSKVTIDKFAHETKCPICGKIFFPPVPKEWVYKIVVRSRYKNVCSYTCASAYRKKEKKE